MKREADTRNSLGLALLLLLLPDPFAAYDVGLLLSFAATYGLLRWSRPIQTVLMRGSLPPIVEKVRKPCASAVAVSLAATITTVPIMAIYFGRISLVSVLANLLTTIPAEAALISGLLASVSAVLGLTVLAQPFMAVAGVLSRYLLWICEKISTFSLATVAIEATYLLLWIVGIYFLWWLGRRVLDGHGRAALAGVCAVILCAGILLHRGARYESLEIDGVSSKNLAVVATYRGSTVLVTAPTSEQPLYRLRDVLQEHAITHVDVLCIIGGKEPAVSHVPLILDAYLTERTHVLYSSLPWQPPLSGYSLDDGAVTLGNTLTVKRCGDHVTVTWNEHTVVFCGTEPIASCCAADVICGVGKTPTVVMTQDGPLAVPEGSGSLVYRDGKWFW